jgi:hypothetical protein
MNIQLALGVMVAALIVADWLTWRRLRRHLIYQGASGYRRGRDLGWTNAELYAPAGQPLLRRLRIIFMGELIAWLLFIVVFMMAR